jgi:carboxyl-terminal processing protease
MVMQGGKMKRHKHLARTAAAVAVAILIWFPRSACAQLTPEEKKLNLDSFEQVWTTIHDQHFDPTFGGLDWQAVHDELRPKMENAGDAQEARTVLTEMISRLGLSHFSIIPADVYKNIDAPVKRGDRGGSTGIAVRVIGGAAIVTSVAPETPAGRAGVKPGWEIRAIDGEEIPPLFPSIEEQFKNSPKRDYYLASAVRSRMGGAIGDTVTIRFIDGTNAPIEKTLTLEEKTGKKIIFGNFPPFYLTTKTDTLEHGIGYFAFSCFFDPITLMPLFGNAMESFMKAPGVIIDVRGNPGGIAGIAMGLAGWFVEEKNIDIGTMRTRTNTLRFVINPRTNAYRGPVAILVDGLSGSSAEIFAGGVQSLPRVRIIGSPTIGATLPSAAVRLPNGDGFQYAFASYISRSGVELEGKGVIPDMEVRPARRALLEGRDPVIETAIDWIQSQRYIVK